MSSIPASMADPLLEVPVDLTDPMYAKVVLRSGADITTGVGGSGTFDMIMTSLSAYLAAEYAKGRITGADYTKTFIELTAAALATALQFTLGKDQAFWQAQQAQIAAVAARVALETSKVQNASANYQLSSMLPAQLVLINEQMEVQRAQTLGVRADGLAVSGNMGAQVTLYNQQVVSYKRDAEIKASKPFTDAWITSKTLDNTIAPPSGFTNANIDIVLSTLMARNAFDGALT
jgi:hypothetical protein